MMKKILIICLMLLLSFQILKIINNKNIISNKNIKYIHTDIFEKNWYKYENFNGLFYDNKTFGIHLFPNSCQIISNSDFRKLINNIEKCDGKWCINNKYKCKLYENKNCYNVEHIIDKNGPEFSNCNKNRIINYVMSYGKWNQQLGNIAFNDYHSSIHEKEIIYGNNNILSVRNMLKYCCKYN